MFLKVILMHTSNVPGHLGMLSFLDLNLQVNRTFPVQLMMRYLTTSADLHVSDLHVLSSFLTLSPSEFAHDLSIQSTSPSKQPGVFFKGVLKPVAAIFSICMLDALLPSSLPPPVCHEIFVLAGLLPSHKNDMFCTSCMFCLFWARGGCGVALGGRLAHVAFGCLCLRHVFFPR